jgi:hypothetical protein
MHWLGQGQAVAQLCWHGCLVLCGTWGMRADAAVKVV